MSETIVTSIRIKAEIWKEAKKRALDLDMNIGDFVNTRNTKEKRIVI